MTDEYWKGAEWEERDEYDRTNRRIWKERLHSDRMGGMFFIPDSSSDVILQCCQGWIQHAQQSRSTKDTPPPSTTALIVSLFSHPFSFFHWKCYRQLVKVHYTLSSWPEIYTPQCFCHARDEECNSLRMTTVHVSLQKLRDFIFTTVLLYGN